MTLRLLAAPVAAITVQLSRYPTGNVLPGEVVVFTVTGVSGFEGDVSRDLDFEWDWDDDGAEFVSATGLPSTNANVDYGRVVAKAWTTTGTKAPQVTVRDRTGILATVTEAVTVQDPNTVSWDKEIYVSFAGNFGGAPASSATIRHVSTIAQLEAEGPTDPATATRIVFRRGEEFAWGANTVSLLGRSYVTSLSTFGSGAFPVLKPGVVVNSAADLGTSAGDDEDEEVEDGDGILTLWNPGNQSRMAVYRVNVDGGYNPATATHSPDLARIQWCRTGNANSGALYRSFCQVRATGMRELYSANGTYRDVQGTNVTYLGVYDVASNNYSNYGLAQWGSQCIIAISGFECTIAPNAVLRDDKDKKRNEATDHGPIRITACEYFGITNSTLLGSGGWTQAGPTYTLQPSLRILPVYTDTGNNNVPANTPDAYQIAVINIQRNRAASSTFVSIGRNKDGDRGFMPRHQAVIARNEFYNRRQAAGSFVSASSSGMCIMNNVIYFANIQEDAGSNFNRILQLQMPIPADWMFAEGWADDPTYVGFNTAISDRTMTQFNNRPVTELQVAETYTGVAPVAENNLIHSAIAGHNQQAFTPFDRIDGFKPAAGSAAIDAVSSGAVPVRDLGGNIRRATTNIGAWDVTGANQAPAAPVNTAVPVIAELAAYPGEYHATSLGAWNNLTHWAEPYLQQYRWRRDATNLPTIFGTQDVWNAGVLDWIADADAGTPTGVQVRQGDNSTGADAQARGRSENARGFNPTTWTIDPGLATPHTLWVSHRTPAVNETQQTPLSIASNATTSRAFTGPTGTFTITGNGDGTYGVTFVPFSGNLTLDVIYTNRSGARVTATSAAVALP